MVCRILYLGDRALTFEFEDHISMQANRNILGIHAVLKEAIARGDFPGVIESVPTLRSLSVHYDPLIIMPNEVEACVMPIISRGAQGIPSGRQWLLPCCYENEYGPDLEDVAKKVNLNTQEIISLHSQNEYDVFMLGFLPGFAFLGMVDASIEIPRRNEPRTVVPAGSVAIADKLTAVYPSQSPGGWNLIGSTPVELFNKDWQTPSLLKAGDKVSFQKISKNEYLSISKAIEKNEYSYESSCLQKEVA
jgi:inhibitor of KinA